MCGEEAPLLTWSGMLVETDVCPVVCTEVAVCTLPSAGLPLLPLLDIGEAPEDEDAEAWEFRGVRQNSCVMRDPFLPFLPFLLFFFLVMTVMKGVSSSFPSTDNGVRTTLEVVPPSL